MQFRRRRTLRTAIIASAALGLIAGGSVLALTSGAGAQTSLALSAAQTSTACATAWSSTAVYTAGGQAVLLHDMWMQGNSNNSGPSSGNATMILDNSPWRGVFWNLSFDGYPFNISTLGAISIQDPSNNSGNVSWTTASAWGTADTTGQQNVYAETNDYHALGYATSTDSQGRAVFRYSLYDNSGIGTHGADTSSYGQRYIDLYDNTFVLRATPTGTPTICNRGHSCVADRWPSITTP